MAYTALYRKWRPAVFEDVKGQEPIVRTLRGQLRTGRIAHAYLLCGSRGTGKTTIARIFAKAVNCENPSDGNPCGKCPSCLAIERGNSMNITEVDAASNNNVDFVRQMLEDMQYPPTEGRYRVYIIDEVHMFSGSSFNALLKTLEEPPEYVIFILATTDPQKIPATILSRCQQYDFRRIDGATIVGRLRELCEGEGIKAEDRALEYIARKAEGGMRDAISLLDQAAGGAGGSLTYESALTALGAVENETFSRYFRALAARDAESLLSLIDEVVMGGRDVSQFTRDLCWYLRSVLLVKTSDINTSAVDAGEADRVRLGEEAGMMSLDEIIRLIRIYSEAFNDMRGSAGKRITLEVAAIRSIRPEADANTDSLSARIGALEQKIAGAISAAAPVTSAPAAASVPVPSPAASTPSPAPAPQPAHTAPEMQPAQEASAFDDAPWPEPPLPDVKSPAAAPAGIGIFERWSEIYSRLDPLTKGMNKGASPVRTSAGTVIYVSSESSLDMAKRYDLVNKMKKIAADEFGIDEALTIKVGDPHDPAADAEADVRAVFPDLIIEG